jgi:hypothetical protein
MKKSIEIMTGLLLTLVLVVSCGKESSETDCSTVTGATFTSSGGRMSSLIASSCSGNSCHSVSSPHAGKFLASTVYASVKPFLAAGAREVINKRMPEGNPLPDSQIQLWQCWQDAGFPE